jgi:hypothetical protein
MGFESTTNNTYRPWLAQYFEPTANARVARVVVASLNRSQAKISKIETIMHEKWAEMLTSKIQEKIDAAGLLDMQSRADRVLGEMIASEPREATDTDDSIKRRILIEMFPHIEDHQQVALEVFLFLRRTVGTTCALKDKDIAKIVTKLNIKEFSSKDDADKKNAMKEAVVSYCCDPQKFELIRDELNGEQEEILAGQLEVMLKDDKYQKMTDAVFEYIFSDGGVDRSKLDTKISAAFNEMNWSKSWLYVSRVLCFGLCLLTALTASNFIASFFNHSNRELKQRLDEWFDYSAVNDPIVQIAGSVLCVLSIAVAYALRPISKEPLQAEQDACRQKLGITTKM